MVWKTELPGVYRGIPDSPVDQETLDIRSKISGLPLRTRETHRFFTWKPISALSKVLDYMKVFASGKTEHHFLSLLGVPGTGKTHLTLAAAWDWLETGRGTVAYRQVEAFLDELRWGYAAHNAYTQKQASGLESVQVEDPNVLINFVKICSLLVLDDLGAEKTTEWAGAKLDEIIDHRYVNGLPTIITSNLAMDQLLPRIADRLMEGKVFVLKASSYRRKGGAR